MGHSEELNVFFLGVVGVVGIIVLLMLIDSVENTKNQTYYFVEDEGVQVKCEDSWHNAFKVELRECENGKIYVDPTSYREMVRE